MSARRALPAGEAGARALNARIVLAALIIVAQLAVLSSVLDRGPGARSQPWVIAVQAAGFVVALALGLMPGRRAGSGRS